MKIEEHKRWFLLGINFTFVSYGVLFLVGLFHGIHRAELQGTAGLTVIFVTVCLLHLSALAFLFIGLCNGVVFIVKQLAAKIRARRDRASAA